MRYKRIPKGLIKKTKATIGFYRFLRYDCGLKYADKLSAKDYKVLINVLKNGRKTQVD